MTYFSPSLSTFTQVIHKPSAVLARVSFEDGDNHAVIEHAAQFTSSIVFGIPNVVLFIETAVEGSLHEDKIDNLMMSWIFTAWHQNALFCTLPKYDHHAWPRTRSV
jgi:hypothetical protein